MLRAVALAAVVPLAGCMGGEPGALGFLASGSEPATRDALRKVQMYDGDVVVRGPAGYCIDRRTLRRDRDGGFVLLASCESLSGLRGHGVEPVLMTISVMPDAPGATRPTPGEIAALMAPAKVIAAHETTDVTLVHFASGGDGVLDGGDARHWRGGMLLNGHLIALALYAREGSPMAGKDGRALLTDLARSIRRASPSRPVAPAATETAPKPATDGSDSSGLSTDSG
ncbi:hypothetical protein [Roseovarius sp.]|uniref:hypothetical protein n=1 Tax=Roseovarius sp. TaxID=1486281 RepID=UPI0032EBAF23